MSKERAHQLTSVLFVIAVTSDLGLHHAREVRDVFQCFPVSVLAMSTARWLLQQLSQFNTAEYVVDSIRNHSWGSSTDNKDDMGKSGYNHGRLVWLFWHLQGSSHVPIAVTGRWCTPVHHLEEGTMSHTGSKARKTRTDKASNAIEERLRLIVDTIPTIVWRKTPDGSADFLNKHFRDYTGLSLEDGMGWGWMNAFHPDDRLKGEWRAALAAGKPFEKEARLRRADGEYRWFLLRAVPLRDEQRNIVEWYGTTSDIEDLKSAEDRIQLIINTIPTMAWSMRADGAVDFVNQRWMDYTGLTLEEEVEEPTRPVHPEDLPRVMEKWLADMAAGEPSEDEIRLRRADGEYRWFLIRTAPLRDERGNVVKWCGVSIDIEDRKRAESQSRTLLDAIPQQIWSGPADGTLDYCNERWRSYMGLGLEELQGEG